MKNLDEKIAHAQQGIADAEHALSEATPHSNNEKSARKALEKHRKRLVKLEKEQRRAS